LAKRLGFWAVAALVCSSRLVEGEGGLVTAALEDWVSAPSVNFAGTFSVKSTLDRMEALVPLALIFSECFGELKITFANASSAGANSVGALDILGAVVVGEEIESVAEFLASAALGGIAELFVQASVALLEVLAGSIDVVLRLAVAALCDIVGTFWKAVATVVAVSSEFLFLLEPEDDNFELAEFSHAQFAHCSE